MPATRARKTQGGSFRENRSGAGAAQGLGSVDTTHTGEGSSVDPGALDTVKVGSQPQCLPSSNQRRPGTPSLSFLAYALPFMPRGL